uniref:ShKT domain-containing protein n=1 Tax=Acrobeloides nanus TaxID=290746 RepID=A0A914CWH8_9BILA
MSSSCQFMVVLVFAAYFVGLEAQTSSTCPPALITGGVGACPTGLTLFSTINKCCNCTGPLIGGTCQTGSFPSTDNTQCCSVPITTTNTTITNTTITTNYVDQVNPLTGTSDCPSRAYLCNNTLYYTLMTQQCPQTCGRTSASVNTTTNTSCADQLKSGTGTSDCSRVSYLCNNTLYS